MIYIGSPFSHADPAVRRWRYEQVAALTVEMIKDGQDVFSPIAYSYELAERFGLSGSWDFWERFDLAFLVRCDELRVYKLPGWQNSRGLNAEMSFARDHDIPITYVNWTKQVWLCDGCFEKAEGPDAECLTMAPPGWPRTCFECDDIIPRFEGSLVYRTLNTGVRE